MGVPSFKQIISYISSLFRLWTPNFSCIERLNLTITLLPYRKIFGWKLKTMQTRIIIQVQIFLIFLKDSVDRKQKTISLASIRIDPLLSWVKSKALNYFLFTDCLLFFLLKTSLLCFVLAFKFRFLFFCKHVLALRYLWGFA